MITKEMMNKKTFMNKIQKIHEYAVKRIISTSYIEIHSQSGIGFLFPHLGNTEEKYKMDRLLFKYLFRRDGIYSFNKDEGICYRYKFNWHNLLCFMQRNHKDLHNSNFCITTSKMVDIEIARNKIIGIDFCCTYPNYKEELPVLEITSCPRYNQVTDRLPKGVVHQLWKGEYEYDIEACAYSLLYQTACIKAKANSDCFILLPRTYLDKERFRQEVAKELNCSVPIAKVILAAILFRGNKPNIKFSTNLQKELIKQKFHYWNWDELQHKIKESALLSSLILEIKYMWTCLEKNWDEMNDYSSHEKFLKYHDEIGYSYSDEDGYEEIITLKGRYSAPSFRSFIYFEIEREVIDLIKDWLDQEGLIHYTKHDSFWCPNNLEEGNKILELVYYIKDRTYLWVNFSIEFFD